LDTGPTPRTAEPLFETVPRSDAVFAPPRLVPELRWRLDLADFVEDVREADSRFEEDAAASPPRVRARELETVSDGSGRLLEERSERSTIASGLTASSGL
jgi:hypothetical protein